MIRPSPSILLVVILTLMWYQGLGGQVWRCRSTRPEDSYMDKMCRDRCVKNECETFCFCNMTEVVDSCGKLDFVPDNVITIDETAEPGTHLFSIPIKDKETWTYALERTASIDGSLWRNLQTYFNFKKFGNTYEMIVDKTPDLEYIYLHYSINLKTLTLSMTCSSPGIPDETVELLLFVKPINEYSPQFIGLPLRKNVPENTPIGALVFSMVNVTIDRDVNPSTKELSVFRMHKYIAQPGVQTKSRLDGMAYFVMSNLQKGLIDVKESLDYEALNAIGSTQFLLNISAADIHGNVSYTTLEIDVTDTNDLPPEFRHPSCPLHIPRSRPCPVSFDARIRPGYKGPLRQILPGPIEARDMDAIGANITLSLDKGPGEVNANAAKFIINNTTGVVTVISPFAKPTEIDLVVVAREVSKLARTTQTPLKVYVVGDKEEGSVTVDLNSFTNHTKDHKASDSDSSNSNSNTASLEHNTIFLIIIGILSTLVLFLAILSTCILCSIKKDQRTKVEPAPPVKNFPFSDQPSSYHRSIDDTSLDITHDDFDLMSELNTYYNRGSKSAHSNKQVVGESNQVPLSGYENDRSESLKDHSYHNNRHLYSDSSVHNAINKKILKSHTSTPQSSRRDEPSNIVYQENVCCPRLSPRTLTSKHKFGSAHDNVRVDQKQPNKDRAALQSKHYAVYNSSSKMQHMSQSSPALGPHQTYDVVNHHRQRSSSSNTSRTGSVRLTTDSVKYHNSSHGHSGKHKSRMLHNNPPYTKCSDVTEETKDNIIKTGSRIVNKLDQNGNVSEKSFIDGRNSNTVIDKSQKPSVKERIIRIPSGILIMKENVNGSELNETSDNLDDDDDIIDDDGNDEESDTTINDDVFTTTNNTSPQNLEYVAPTPTPAPPPSDNGANKLRVSFQLEPSHSQVLSVLPMEQSSTCVSSDDAIKPRPKCQPAVIESNTNPNTDTHGNSDTTTPDDGTNNLHVPECSITPIHGLRIPETFCKDESIKDDNDRLFQKVSAEDTIYKIAANSEEAQQPTKPRRLPELNIPGRKNLNKLNSKMGSLPEEERAQSENVILQNHLLNSVKGAPDLEGRSCHSLETDPARSAIRKKKRRRRSLSQQRRTSECNSSDVERDKEIQS